jgi:hypothetical protein
MREQRGTVHTLACGEQVLQVIPALDDEVQRLEPSVSSGIPEIHHLDAVGFDEPDQVLTGKILGGFVKIMDERIRIKGYGVFHGIPGSKGLRDCKGIKNQ